MSGRHQLVCSSPPPACSPRSSLNLHSKQHSLTHNSASTRLQVIVYKMKPKKHTRRKNGHRQSLSKFMVTKISLN